MDTYLVTMLCGLGWTLLIVAARAWWSDRRQVWQTEDERAAAVGQARAAEYEAMCEAARLRAERQQAEYARREAEARADSATAELDSLRERVALWERWVNARHSR